MLVGNVESSTVGEARALLNNVPNSCEQERCAWVSHDDLLWALTCPSAEERSSNAPISKSPIANASEDV
jgi:hypothetical protein